MRATVLPLLGVLLFAGVMVMGHLILKCRYRWRYRRAAARLGFSLGRVRSRVTESPLVERGFTSVSLRPGDLQDVVHSIRAEALAAGYVELEEPRASWGCQLQEWPGGSPPLRLRFWPPPGLTSLTLLAYASGWAIPSSSRPRARSVTVPPGHTGLKIMLT
jgi:hypothetical protein